MEKLEQEVVMAKLGEGGDRAVVEPSVGILDNLFQHLVAEGVADIRLHDSKGNV